jgi:MscS family membrane protein
MREVSRACIEVVGVLKNRTDPHLSFGAEVASNRLMIVFIRKIFPVVFLGLCVMNLRGQTPPVPIPGVSQDLKEAVQKDPFNRVSPQSSIISFLESCRSKNFERAARYLDLEKMSRDQRRTERPGLAQQLGRVLDRDAEFDVGDLNGDPSGDLTDGVPRNRERIRSYDLNGKALDLQLERKTLRSGLEVWVFSADSVALIPELVQVTSDSPIERYLPPVLVSWTLAGTPVWRWIGLALIALAVAALSRALARLGIFVLRPVARIFFPKLESGLLQAVAGPAQIVLASVFLRAGVEWLAPPALLRLYLARLCTLLVIVGGTWFAANLVDLVIERIRLRLEARQSTLSRSALPLASRGVKITVFVFAATAIIGSWGYNTSTILAGLGIGGIAIALAAQKTIENLFGGVAVVSDRPVAVGDFCKFGDRVGTVEDIGLRSTRVRTLDRTVVSIPNAEFSSMVLENFSQRDKVLFHPTLNLRRDTRPDQVRSILDAIRRILTEDQDVEVGTLPVRFIGAGQYSLDVEIFAYIRTANYDEFLKIQQDLLLRIMDEISAAGTALALPTQASISYSEEVFGNHQMAPPEKTTDGSR